MEEENSQVAYQKDAILRTLQLLKEYGHSSMSMDNLFHVCMEDPICKAYYKEHRWLMTMVFQTALNRHIEQYII